MVALTVSPEESLDLFRHAYELDGHLEAAAAFAQQVVAVYGSRAGSESDDWTCPCGGRLNCSAGICNICQRKRVERPPTSCLHAVATHYWTMAADALSRRVAGAAQEAWGWNALGVAQERLGLHRAAAEAYAQALVTATLEQRNRVLLNLARVTAHTAGPSNAFALWQQTSIALWEDWCTVALAYAAAGELPSAYQVSLRCFV